MEPKLCRDKLCLEETWICIQCSRLCCRHFCVNRDSKGSAICTNCIIIARAKTIERQENV